MTDRILRKAIEKIDGMPRQELKRIMVSQLMTSDLLQSLLENSREGHCVLQDGLIRYANVSTVSIFREAKAITSTRS